MFGSGRSLDRVFKGWEQKASRVGYRVSEPTEFQTYRVSDLSVQLSPTLGLFVN